MTDIVERPQGAAAVGVHATDEAQKRLKRRYASEWRFRAYGLSAIVISIVALAVLLTSIVSQGYTAFTATTMTLTVTVDPALADPAGKGNRDDLRAGDYQGIARAGLRTYFPELKERNELRALYSLLSNGASDAIRDQVMANPALIGQKITVRVPVASDYDMYAKGHTAKTPKGGEARLSPQQIAWFETLKADGKIQRSFNLWFLTSGDSRQPELAGVGGAIVGSLLTLAITLAIAFPLGVMAAVYLEEFAPKNRWTDLIEVNINNLAAVPSIVFGLLGLAVFLNVFGLPRSAPVVGGVVLALMSLPIIIIASRASLRAVPPSIRQAALGLGASRVQVVTHHVLPLAMPGILTGTILSMAHALGETAPLLMIGMVAFIVDIPSGATQAATVLPVQIYLWADSPERGFVEKTSAAIMVLLAFLLAMNAIAIILRKKFERKW